MYPDHQHLPGSRPEIRSEQTSRLASWFPKAPFLVYTLFSSVHCQGSLGARPRDNSQRMTEACASHSPRPAVEKSTNALETPYDMPWNNRWYRQSMMCPDACAVSPLGLLEHQRQL